MVTLSFSKTIVEELEKELIRAHELNNLRLYQLAQGVLWIDQGKPWKVISELWGVSVKTVGNGLKRFLVQGLGWVRSQHYRGRGRQSKLSGEQKCVGSAEIGILPHRNELVARGAGSPTRRTGKEPAPLPS